MLRGLGGGPPAVRSTVGACAGSSRPLVKYPRFLMRAVRFAHLTIYSAIKLVRTNDPATLRAVLCTVRFRCIFVLVF